MGHRGGLVDARRLMSLLLLEIQGDAELRPKRLIGVEGDGLADWVCLNCFSGKPNRPEWSLVHLRLTFPVQPTPFQIQKYTRTHAMASVIASGTRIWPGFSKPSVISCTLRL